MKNIVVILDMTNDCNFRCEYCYLSAGENKDQLSVDTAICAIDKIYEKYKCIINILFHGGEPLFCFGTIKKILEELKKKDYISFLRFSIQTNGYFINDEVVDFFIDNNFSVGISIDGYDDKGNGARKDKEGRYTTERVIDNMKMLIDRKCSISILSVINKYNYNVMGNVIDRFYEIGIDSFTINPFIPAGRGRQFHLGVSSENMFETYKDIIDKIISYRKRGRNICEKNIYFLCKKIATGNSGYMCMCVPCGAGLAQYTIAPDGNVYPCADFSGIEIFSMGNVKSDFFENMLFNEQWKKIRMNRLIKYEHCQKCSLVKMCTAGCSVRSYFNNGRVDSIDPICELNKLLIPYMMKTEIWEELGFGDLIK